MDNLSVNKVEKKVNGASSLVFAVAGDRALAEAFERWLLERDRSQATVRNYRRGVEKFQGWFERTVGKALDPVAITPLDVRAYKAWLQNTEKLTPNSVNHYLAGLRAFCRWAQSCGKVEHNAADGIKGVAEQAHAPKWLERTEQYALLRAVEQAVQVGELRASGKATAPGNVWPKRDRAIVRLLLAAGLRLAEAVALTLDDVTIHERSGSVTVRAGKGNKLRVVALNSDARKAVQAWLDVRTQTQTEAEELFISQKGGALSAHGMARVIGTAGIEAGLGGLHPHILRHSAAKNLVDQGIGIDKVAMLLGHRSLETTRLYTIPSEADLQAAVELTNWED